MRLVLQLLTFNSSRFLPHLFASLEAQTDRDWTFLINDNGSSPDELKKTREIVGSYTDKLHITFTEGENTGFAGGQQMLWEKNTADLVLCVNHDVLFTPTYIETVRQFMEAHPDVAAAAGEIRRWEWGSDGQPLLMDTVDSLGLIRARFHKVYDATTRIDPSPYVWGVSGCLPMYRRVAIGPDLYDPSYFLYKEDVDVAYRLNRQGHKSALVPSAIAYHFRGFQASRLHRGVSPKAQFMSYVNHWHNLKKHLSLSDWLKDGWAIVPFEIAKAAFLFVTHPIAFPRYVLRYCYHHRHL